MNFINLRIVKSKKLVLKNPLLFIYKPLGNIRMTKIFLTLLTFIFILSSCKTTSNHIVENTTKESRETIKTNDRILKLIISSDDLSEDMSRLSSKNDEILLLFYKISDNPILDSPTHMEKFVFDKKEKNLKSIFIPNIDKTKKFILFLLEQDSETPIEQLDSTIRINYKKLIEIFNDKDYMEIEKYLGDEDILGIKIIDFQNINSLKTINFQGVHRFDNYNYSIKIK